MLGWLVVAFLIGTTDACVWNTTVAPGNSSWTESVTDAVNRVCDGGIVYLYRGLFSSASSHCNVAISKSLTFKAYGADGDMDTTYDCPGSVFSLANDVAFLTLEGISFENGTSTVLSYGGNKIGTLTIDGCTFSGFGGNYPLETNGPDQTTNIANSKFDANTGGALLVTGGNLTVSNTHFTNNRRVTGCAAVSLTGTASFSGSHFINNVPMAIHQTNDTQADTSRITVSGCTFTSNTAPHMGGAINVPFPLSVTGSTFNLNTAPVGGAIAAPAIAISHSHFVSNTADREGGAVYLSSDLPATIEHSTFTNNHVGDLESKGGAIWTPGNVHITGSSFSSNSVGLVGMGGAIYAEMADVATSSFTANSAHHGGAMRIVGGSKFANSSFTANTAVYYGGALHMPMQGNVELYGCDAAGNMAKQGGVLYAPHGLTAVGRSSFSNNSAIQNTFWVNVTKQYNNTVPYPSRWQDYTFNYSFIEEGGFGGALSVDEAIISESDFHGNEATVAGGAVSGTDIVIEKGLYMFNQAGAGGAVYIMRDANLTGAEFSSNTATLLGGGALGHVAPVNYTTTTTIDACTFTNNMASEWGGAVCSVQHIFVKDSTFDGNTAAQGGAVYSEDGCEAHDNTFSRNAVGGSVWNDADGGAVYAPMLGDHSNTYTGNSAANNGGAVMTPHLKSDRSKYHSNSASGSGGAVSITIEAHMEGVVMEHNNAVNDGGAVESTASLTMHDCEFSYNQGESMGGAIHSHGSIMALRSSFLGNTGNSGGAVWTSGPLDLSQSMFNQNSANGSTASEGGAVTTLSGGNVTDCRFFSNMAINGGAIHYHNNLTVTRGMFASNSAQQNGGGLSCSTSVAQLDVMMSTFTSNSAQKGGALYSDGQVTRLDDSTFSTNSATEYGGGLYVTGVTTVMGGKFSDNTGAYGGAVASLRETVTERCLFQRNLASEHGGAIWTQQSLSVHPECYFDHNQATHYGGAVYVHTGLDENSPSGLQVDHAEFTENKATYGAAIFAHKVTLSHVQNTEFVANTAGLRGPSVYHLAPLTTLNNSYILNDCPLDKQGEYLNTWYTPDNRRAVTNMYFHWVVHPTLQVGNRMQLQLPMELELNQCDLDYHDEGCNSTAEVEGFLPGPPDVTTIDAKKNLLSFNWERQGMLNMTQKDVYVIKLTNVRTPNHCENLTYSVSMQHCWLDDIMGAGKYFRRVCEYDGDDYKYTSEFMTAELTGTPKGCTACNACWKSEWDGIWRCHHGNAKYFSRSYLDQPTCSAAT